MKELRIYVDTSVIGGCFDPEFARWSNRLMKDFRARRFLPVLSELLGAEIARAPEPVQALHEELLELAAERLAVSNAALELLSHYEERSVLGLRFRADMLHIALATVADVDVLVSWNFKHIVRFDKIRMFNAASLELGYKALAIHSPREVASDERE